MKTRFARIEDAVETISKGGVVIVVDSEDRENEGDFIAAAESVTPDMIHFMISEGRGQLCMPVLPDLAERLNLRLMVPDMKDAGPPRFAIPVDHLTCSTGISPWERAHTIRCMLDPTSQADDYVQPGHIFPLIAETEGVLKRLGHTESAIDLARAAGLFPAGVLCEVCSQDGVNMAERDELMQIADRHDLLVVTIDALVEYVGGRVPATKNSRTSVACAVASTF